MKFIVSKDYGNEFNVRLHPETKRKLKRSLYWGFMGVCGSIIAAAKISERKKIQTPIED